MDTIEYREWLDAAAHVEDGHYRANAGISIGAVILIVLLVALIF